MYQPRPNSELRTGRPNPPRGSAFSLIELILVMTIISILAAIAVPRYGEALSRYRVDAAARRVVVDLDYARQLAQSTSASVSIRIHSGNDRVRLIDIPNPDYAGSSHTDTELWSRPYYADVVSSDFGGDMMVIFDGYGVPDTGGTAILAVGTQTRNVVLDLDSGLAGVQ